jgi:hypothetical protein
MAKMDKQKDLKIVKKFEDGSCLFANGWMRTGPVRISFVNFAKAKVSEDDDGNEREKFGCAVLIPKGASLAAYKLCQERYLKTLGSGASKLKRKSVLRKQDEKVGDYDGFVNGAYFFNTSSKYRPKVKGREMEEIEVDAFYSGCFARLTLSPYNYGLADRKKTKGNSGIGLGLQAAQFIRDGEPLGGGGVDPDDVFDEYEGDDMSADDDSGEGEDENEFV